MRKFVGVFAVLAALSMVAWAQTPTPAPATTPPAAPSAGQSSAPASAPATTPTPDQTPAAQTADIPAPTQKTASVAASYPRLEVFLGGTYSEAGLFNAGHWAGLPGWDASLGLNATSWIGVVFEGGQYFGTSKISSSEPLPFPNCPPFCPGTFPTFNVSTREYNFLFGLQFARRKWENWTPIGELLYGHQGTRGVATGNHATDTEVGTGRALVAGGGLEHKINARLALRVKADYFQSATDFSLLGKKKQDNFRVSVGIVIRNVHKKKRTLEDETQVEP